MKKIFCSLIVLLFTITTFSQKTIENPIMGYTNAPYLSIQKIEIKDSTTVVSFEITNEAGFGFSVPKKTYIKDVDRDEKLFVKTAVGVPLEKGIKLPQSGVLKYQLIFGKLDKSVKKIDFGEGNNNPDNWSILDIVVNEQPQEQILPKELIGNWFNTENANWEFGFNDNNAIYKSQVWLYDAVNLKKGSGSISLKNKNQKVTLFVKKGKIGTYAIGENPKLLINYSNTRESLVTKPTNDDMSYELPIFKSDSATYSGYIKNYTPRVKIKTIVIHINDIISGEQNTHTAKIDENGFFSVKMPIYYPHEVWVRSPVFNGSVFLEPGKSVFQLLGVKNSLFMGESAKINSDIIQFNPRWFNYDEVSSKILDMKPMDYKAYCQNLANKEMDKLETLKKANAISSKAYQVKKIDIQYEAISQMMSYKRNFEGAYRIKNKIPRDQRTLDIKTEPLGVDYYDFVTETVVNNAVAVLSNEYNSFINDLQYTDLLRPKSITSNPLDVAEELHNRGYLFTQEEQLLVAGLKTIEDLKNSPEQKEFQNKYREIGNSFFIKHQKIFQEVTKNESFSFSNLENYLIKNKIPISKEEEAFLVAEKELAKMASSTKLKQLYISIAKNQNDFYGKHKSVQDYLISLQMDTFRNKQLNELFNVKNGSATDIMTSQDICKSVVEQLTPLSEEDLVRTLQSIQTPFIADYIRKANEQTLAKIEANKSKTDYVLNETPKTEADELFASIMKKYKGKVVYVDFWATWCGPCRSGMEQIKPLKEELKDENVVFVYLTNQTSPEKTYSAMIPEIKGEHYRLSQDEWNYLSAKFNISGIPHYVLVGKNGEVINPKLGHKSNEELKVILEKRMKE